MRHAKTDAPLEAAETAADWSRARLVTMAAGTLVFALLLVWVVRTGVTPLDAAVIEAVLPLRTDGLTVVVKQVTSLVLPPVLLAVSLAVAPFVQARHPWLYLALGTGTASLLNSLVKLLVARPRPDEALRLAIETSMSFPSGHTMAAMSFYGLLIYLLWRTSAGRLPGRRLWTALLGLLILGIGLSRIYLCVHYATDVLAGVALSLVWLSLYTKVADRLL